MSEQTDKFLFVELISFMLSKHGVPLCGVSKNRNQTALQSGFPCFENTQSKRWLFRILIRSRKML